VVFWKPAPHVDPFLPADAPIGEAMYGSVRSGQRSDHLLDWDVAEFEGRFLAAFPSASFGDDGAVTWFDDLDESSIVLRPGVQHVDVVVFEDLEADGVERLWEIAESLGLQHFDGWRFR